jgi:hypothetical protein
VYHADSPQGSLKRKEAKIQTPIDLTAKYSPWTSTSTFSGQNGTRLELDDNHGMLIESVNVCADNKSKNNNM